MSEFDDGAFSTGSNSDSELDDIEPLPPPIDQNSSSLEPVDPVSGAVQTGNGKDTLGEIKEMLTVLISKVSENEKAILALKEDIQWV